MTTISLSAIRAAITDPRKAQQLLANHFNIRAVEEQGFAFHRQLAPDGVFPKLGPLSLEPLAWEAADLIGLFENTLRRWRYRRDKRRGLPRIVTEGDSWFSHPLLLDVVDQLHGRYAVRCLSNPGHKLGDMLEDIAELKEALAEESPTYLLLSGGGNGCIGSCFGQWLKDADGSEPGHRYIRWEAYRAHVEQMLGKWRTLLDAALSASDAVRILWHGYDYALPVPFEQPDHRRVSGPHRLPYLSKPLDARGVQDEQERRLIVRLLLDYTNGRYAELDKAYPRARHVDLRGTLGDGDWDDELHPNDAGYAKLAQRFDSAMKDWSASPQGNGYAGFSTKQRLAVLGGGIGALSTVFSITDQEGWQDNFDITIYSLGWRLGGKCATGTNAQAHDRIEEHGYHTLFGFYENAFAMLRRCYEQYGRDPSLPFSELIAPNRELERQHPSRYGLHREDFFIMQQQLADGSWHSFPIDFPENTELPGDGREWPHAFVYLEEALELLWRLVGGIRAAAPQRTHRTQLQPPAWWRHVRDYEPKLQAGMDPRSEEAHNHRGNIEVMRRLCKHLVDCHDSPHDTKKIEQKGLSLLVSMMRLYLKALWLIVRHDVTTHWLHYVLWTTSDFVCTVAIGMIEDDVISKGFNSIDDLNFFEWLVKWQTVPEGSYITNSSMWVQAAYDSSFAYLNGNTTEPRSPEKPPLGTPSMGAGTMLRGGIRLMLTYKGAMAWKFQAGTASIIVAPLYTVLKERGVKFELFSNIKNLGVGRDEEGRLVIDTVEIEKQVKLKDPAAGYQPLVNANDVPAWPSEPLWDQIEDAEQIRKYNLESFWTPWQGVGTQTLKRGSDYDLVLLAIPTGASRFITAELSDASPSWKRMLDEVKSVRTQAVELWLTKDLEQLGWSGQDAPVNVGVQPLDTWADMSQWLEIESWGQTRPASLSLFCSAFRDDPQQPQPPDEGYAATQHQWVRENGVYFLQNQSSQFWPNAHQNGGFDWGVLYGEGSGQQRLDGQFFKANIDPSERYVLSVPGSVHARLSAHGSDFHNLYLAGDWTLCGLNVGCVEATVTSGLLASQAIAGYPAQVRGVEDWGPEMARRNRTAQLQSDAVEPLQR